MFQKSLQSVIITSLMLLLAASLSACDNSQPPELMKAVKQFKSDEIRDAHVENMRKNHMNELLHKRDETVIQGIRTKKHSLNACINCHVPEEHNGKVLRHTDPEHFCSTCHSYVAEQLDCFQCHVDHPTNQKASKAAPKDAIHNSVVKAPAKKHLSSNVAQLLTTNIPKATPSVTPTENTPKQPIGERQ